jgi:hypothetical protein
LEHIDMWHFRKKILVAVVLGVITVTVAGIAIAAWSVSGSGTGYAKASTASAVTLGDATAESTATLYPGASGTAKLKVSNPNPFPVRITAVAGNGTITTADATCNASHGVSFVNQTGLQLDLAANASDQMFTLASGSVTMSNASVDECQGDVFSIPVTVTAVSNAA